MHHLLSLQRLPSNAPGDYNAQSAGQRCDSQPHPAEAEGDFPAASSLYSAGMGCCPESQAPGGGDAIPGSDARNSAPVSSCFTSRFSRVAATVARRGALEFIRLYQVFVSPALPPSCRFYPTCSSYAYGAVEKWGLGRGAWLALRRLLRCHPFGGHGYDPIP